jgi:hypothetical protein
MQSRFFGYDDKGGRHWVNLDHVVKVSYFPEQERAEIYLAVSRDGTDAMTRIELSGPTAEKLRDAIGSFVK